MDDHVLVLPENATPPMDFGTDNHSDEECASALEQPHAHELDLHQTRSHPPDEGEVENSDEEYANFDINQRHLLQAPAEGRSPLTQRASGLAGAAAEYDPAQSSGANNNFIVDVATRETVQGLTASGSQQRPRLVTQSADRLGDSGTAPRRRLQATPGVEQHADTHAIQELLPDGDGSPQPPVSARGPPREPEQPRPQPPAAAGSAAYVTADEQREQPQPPAAPGSASRHSEVHTEQLQPPAAPGSAPHDLYSDVRYEQPQPPAAPGSARRLYSHAHLEQPQPP